MSDWKREKPLSKKQAGLRSECEYCGPQPVVLSMDAILAVGFGGVTVRKDDKIIWSGDDEEKKLEEIENLATNDPEHDWRIEFYAPLSSTVYQRQGRWQWMLIEKGKGFEQ